MFLFFILGNISLASTVNKEKKHCSGFAKWKDGEFIQIRESKCITDAEYQAYLKVISSWEREYLLLNV